MKVDLPPFERYLAGVRAIGFRRPLGTVDYTAYERMKREFIGAFPQATPAEYERAMQTIAKAAGV